MIQSKLHTIESKTVGAAPLHRGRRRMDQDSELLKGGSMIQELRIRSAVVQQDGRGRIQEVEIAHQVNYTILILMH